jgi:hypothetical protein
LRLLIIGSKDHSSELSTQIPERRLSEIKYTANYESGFDVIIITHDAIHNLNIEPNSKSLFIFSSVTNTLSSIKTGYDIRYACGMNLLPGFISMSVKELHADDQAFGQFNRFNAFLNWQVKRVPDIPGMVTLRVLSMIINEAAATIAEGTASVEDIDKGMMLGTNYPKGPLQWCDEIGAVYIVETLNNLFTYTSDSRYQAHQFLTQLARSGKTFYTSKIKEEAQS